MKRTLPKHSLVAAAAMSLAALTACSSESTGPAGVLTTSGEASIQSPGSPSLLRPSNIHKLKGKGDDEFTVDTDAGVIADNHGHSISVDREVAERIGNHFDRISRGNAVADAIEKNPGYQNCLATGKARGRKARPITVSISTAPRPPAAQTSLKVSTTLLSNTSSYRLVGDRLGIRRPAPSGPSFVIAPEDGSDCFDLSTRMSDLTQHWHYLQDEYVTGIAAVIAGGATISIADGLQIDPEAVLYALGGFGAVWAADYIYTFQQMGIIGGLMNQYNCIYGNDGTWPTFGVTLSQGFGTQYQVGDYTGGQTVDFATGRGTGEASECGINARVAYIKIEAYDDTTGNWVQIAEGYSTTCG